MAHQCIIVFQHRLVHSARTHLVSRVQIRTMVDIFSTDNFKITILPNRNPFAFIELSLRRCSSGPVESETPLIRTMPETPPMHLRGPDDGVSGCSDNSVYNQLKEVCLLSIAYTLYGSYFLAALMTRVSACRL